MNFPQMPLKDFHFSRRRAICETGRTELGQDLELRIHIEPTGTKKARGWHRQGHGKMALLGRPSSSHLFPEAIECRRQTWAVY
jgi:hypothetical protein